MALAIFPWKKEKEQPAATNGAGNAGGGKAVGGEGMEFSASKAESWFRYAAAAQESSNFEYAMTCWLSGLRFDPANMKGVEGFFASAASFRANGGKSVSKDMQKAISGSTPVDKYLRAILAWGLEPNKLDLAVEAAVQPATLGLMEPSAWIARSALGTLLQDPKARKNQFLKLMEIFSKVGNAELAVRAGEEAQKLDPTDGQLANQVKNLAAQATMTKGGYEQTGQAGGFRSNIRDADKQRQLEEQDRIVRSEATIDRIVLSTKTDYEANPLDRANVKRYVKALRDRGTPEDEDAALAVLDKAYGQLQEAQFRIESGELRMRQSKRAIKALKAAAEAAPSDAGALAALKDAAKRHAELEVEEAEFAVASYPTDLRIKFELGKKYLTVGKTEAAIELFQLAKADTRNKAAVLQHLAMAFQTIGWQDEAIETFREAATAVPDGAEQLAMDLRYGLMCSLQQRAEEHRDLANAEEANKIAGAIAMQQLGYKDIRQRREQIKALVMQLKSGAAG